ncbi:MAG TPA: RNA 2',3'-cyclic phosphodiesterase [Burkholderiales bacterium]
MEAAPAGPGTQRLFVALWPDERARAAIAAAAEALALRGGRATAPRNLHATLVFLGAADAARRACIERAAAAVRGEPFELALDAVTWRRRGGLVWLTGAVPPALAALVAQLNAELAHCGHRPEARPYRLHVTLARNARSIGRDRVVAPIRWQAQEFCLVSSRPTPAGSEYTVEARWPLAAGG